MRASRPAFRENARHSVSKCATFISGVLGGVCALWLCVGAALGASPQSSAKLPDVSGIPAVSPVSNSSSSIAKGKATFLRLCTECHDDDGKALAQSMGPAADLTDPSRWKYGTADAYVFRSIRDGAGAAMPVFGSQLKNEDIWDIVSFIRSIGPTSLQPSHKP